MTRLVPSDNACWMAASSKSPDSHARFDPFGIIDGASGHTRQTAPAWVDVGLAELHFRVESHQSGFGITKARQSTYLGQRCQSGQTTSVPTLMDVGVDSVHALSWTRLIGPLVRARQATVTTGPPTDAYAECWRPRRMQISIILHFHQHICLMLCGNNTVFRHQYTMADLVESMPISINQLVA